MTEALAAAIAVYLASHSPTLCRPGTATNRLVWQIATHPTRRIPLGLGVVGRW